MSSQITEEDIKSRGNTVTPNETPTDRAMDAANGDQSTDTTNNQESESFWVRWAGPHRSTEPSPEIPMPTPNVPPPPPPPPPHPHILFCKACGLHTKRCAICEKKGESVTEHKRCLHDRIVHENMNEEYFRCRCCGHKTYLYKNKK
ncbi:hypothetical protein QR680_002999 [Steinernema hermaphroditum]|uniref:Uncharacterized protein n=1 Tax=Steinernema hermaphroditum TaxID=289476 RepID=A0AA39H550_9BILA|nr:hypothetical protein QR680_002999 [Steinernema hermaphroditum]